MEKARKRVNLAVKNIVRNISKDPIVCPFFWPTTLSPFPLKINAEPFISPTGAIRKQTNCLISSIADALSRSDWQRFKTLCPEADPEPTEIPDHLWKICSEN
jgi:hypothetical protein